MDFRDLIAVRRDGRTHTAEELDALAQAAAKGTVPDYQLAAWLMAAFLNPLDEEQTANLTIAMADSGKRIDLSGLPKPWVDKHSTGGVGDKTTLVLLPLLSACGLTMVKLSGRGLGIAGGTIDKLASFDGLRLDLSPDEAREIAGRIGLSLSGASPALAPADKVLYALRDATATVESISLIASSILSKKIAGGAETVVMDVKTGSGAYMQTFPESHELAQWLVRIGERCGLRVRAAITDMDQPLGSAVGNTIEVEEARSLLRGDELAPPVARFRALCLDLARLTLSAVGSSVDPEAVLESGAAWDRFRDWISAQGGDPEQKFEDAPVRMTVKAERAGILARLDARTVGEAVVDLGGGRQHKEDTIDLRVGVMVRKNVGDSVAEGDVIADVLAADEESGRAAVTDILKGIVIADSAEPRPALIEVIGGSV
ncbi:thymidine phosphorylase [bacterium]|nr:MAG: thymidine phosphorylase [bacterium]